jgi:hypothetical protein
VLILKEFSLLKWQIFIGSTFNLNNFKKKLNKKHFALEEIAKT